VPILPLALVMDGALQRLSLLPRWERENMNVSKSCAVLLVLAAFGCNGAVPSGPSSTSAASTASTNTAPTTSGGGTTTPPKTPPTTPGSTHMSVSDVGDPSGPEQELIELANRARRDPIAEGNRYGLNFTGIPATPPLAPNALLAKAALSHTTDMAVNHYYDHQNPAGGPNPAQQITAAGYAWLGYGQNIDCGPVQPVDAKSEHQRFIVDAGVNPPGHRWNILGYSPTPPQDVHREMGTSYISSQVIAVGATWDQYITENLATSKDDKPFVTGVVFNDLDNSGEYDAGEGVKGVTVKLTAASDLSFLVTKTATAGGFAFEVTDPGDYTLEMSGGPFATPVTMKVTVANDNVKVDGVVGKGLVKH
jgi:uncharacterized protein YkwD